MKTVTETPAVVLITGALTGIGRATAIAFAKDGAHTVVSGRRDEEGQKLVTELRKLGRFLRWLSKHRRFSERLYPTPHADHF